MKGKIIEYKYDRMTFVVGKWKVSYKYHENGLMSRKIYYRDSDHLALYDYGRSFEWDQKGNLINQNSGTADPTYNHGVSIDYYKSDRKDGKIFRLYGRRVSEEEYRKHELIEGLSGI